MPTKFTIDDYRYDAGMLLSCSHRKLIKIARKWDGEARNRYTVYQGLTHEQSVAVAQINRDDALYVLSLKS